MCVCNCTNCIIMHEIQLNKREKKQHKNKH